MASTSRERNRALRQLVTLFGPDRRNEHLSANQAGRNDVDEHFGFCSLYLFFNSIIAPGRRGLNFIFFVVLFVILFLPS
jgi:hypothetical protein